MPERDEKGRALNLGDSELALLSSLPHGNCSLGIDALTDGTFLIQVEVDYVTVTAARMFQLEIGDILARYMNASPISSRLVITIHCEEQSSIHTFFMPGKEQFGAALCAVPAALIPNSDEEVEWRNGTWQSVYSED